MIPRKKTLYEVLEVQAKATFTEIQAAYIGSIQKIQSTNSMPQQDADIQLKLIKLAYDTLSSEATRMAYDAKLFGLQSKAASEPVNIFVPIQIEPAGESTRKSPLRTILIVIACLIAAGMAIQTVFMSLAYRNAQKMMDASGGAMTNAAKAEEKVRLQEYYQEHGVRPGNETEMDLLNAEENRQKGEERQKERAQAEKERAYRQFVEESRRVGDQVSADLRRAEEQAQYEAEQKRQRLEEEKRLQEEAERIRIENEKEKWRIR